MNQMCFQEYLLFVRKDKLFSTLSTFKKEDIENMAEDGKICATCHFCSTKYIFDKEEFVKH